MKTDIRLIVTDLDNTLLTTEKTLSDGNREALMRCVDAGIAIVPCTGRLWIGIPESVRTLPGVRYAITVNGGKVEDLENHTTIAKKTMPCETALSLFEMISHYPVMYGCYIDDHGYGDPRFLSNMDAYLVPKPIQQMVHETSKPVPDLIEFVRKTNRPLDKISFNFGDLELRERIKSELACRDDLVVSASLSTNLEINGPGVTKGDGILTLCDYLGIDPKQTMAFGDGENDLSMIKVAGIGVAMGNAIDEVKEAADYVTLSNDDDGVAAAINHFLFDGT